MDTKTIQRGALTGVVGGVVMAIWAMSALWAGGPGFFAPLNLLAHTLWRGAPLDGVFSVGAAVLGVAIHMVTSVVLGVVLALVVGRIGASWNRTGQLVSGLAFGLIVWVVAQFGIWPLVDGQAAPKFTPWAFAIGHAIFGLVTAGALYLTSARPGGLVLHTARTSGR